MNPADKFMSLMTEDDDSAFALLRPISFDAQNAFKATIDAYLENPASLDLDHLRHFLHIDERSRQRSPSLYSEDENEEVVQASSSSRQLTGGFKFNLGASLSNGSRGWLLGSNTDAKEIDFLLAPGKNYKSTRIAHKHARVFLHPQSYRLILEALHSVVIGDVIVTQGAQRTLENGNIIHIGPSCTYSFHYTELFQTRQFTTSLSSFIKTHHGNGILHPLLQPHSVGEPIPLGNYFCSPYSFNSGTFGVLSVGWDRKGMAVAIKRFKRPFEQEISLHRKMMENIKGHDNIVQLHDCITNFTASTPSAYCIYTPLAATTLREVISVNEVSIEAKLALLSDYLCGLSYLHQEKGIMHLDISPGNLAITSLENPKGIIIDLDAAKESNEPCFDHMKGTLSYLAPEIIGLKLERSLAPFDKQVDIWALGICFFELQQNRCLGWDSLSIDETSILPSSEQESNSVNASRYAKFLETIAEKKGSAGIGNDARLWRWIQQMTRYKAADRCTASDLYSKVFEISDKLGRGKISSPTTAAERRRE